MRAAAARVVALDGRHVGLGSPIAPAPGGSGSGQKAPRARVAPLLNGR